MNAVSQEEFAACVSLAKKNKKPGLAQALVDFAKAGKRLNKEDTWTQEGKRN